jgi:hypothetical protein
VLQGGIHLTTSETSDLIDFMKNALLDKRATNLCGLVPSSVPSGLPVLHFEACGTH